MMRLAAAPASQQVVTTALGVTLILSWGSSYYLLAVLAGPIARDTGWPLTWVVSGLSIGLLIAGALSPLVGRLIQRHGGGPVLATGSALLAAGLAGLAIAPSVAAFLAAWAIIGAGMSATLYDAAFAAMGRLYGREARGAITTLTLWAGFASTLCWPLSAWLLEASGWRNTCLAYAAIHLAVCLPIHLACIPGAGRGEVTTPGSPSVLAKPEGVAIPSGIFIHLAVILTLAAFVASTVSVHLLALLEGRGLSAAEAVALGALIGPAQVGARLLEMLVGRRYHPMQAMVVAVALIAAGMVLLLMRLPLPGLALVLYGGGNGLLTIARGALPLVLFDPRHYAIIMGRLALPSLVVQAAAPMLGAWLLVGNGTQLLAVLAGTSLAALTMCALLARAVRE